MMNDPVALTAMDASRRFVSPMEPMEGSALHGDRHSKATQRPSSRRSTGPSYAPTLPSHRNAEPPMLPLVYHWRRMATVNSP